MAKIAWGNAWTAVGLVSSAQTSMSSARPVSALELVPMGCCMREFATMMK